MFTEHAQMHAGRCEKDLMKSTAVDESLSNTSTNVLFQRIPTSFRISDKCVLDVGWFS